MAHAGRIGGATDLGQAYGRRFEHVLQRRGRWGSDLQFIYDRISADEQYEASAAMAMANGRVLEEVCPTWVQGNQRY